VLGGTYTSTDDGLAGATRASRQHAGSHRLGPRPAARDSPQIEQITAQRVWAPDVTWIRVRGSVPGLSADEFRTAAEGAKTNCPVSKALTGTTITLEADLA
jgi:lipoyl-dependent peroxiredoxin